MNTIKSSQFILKNLTRGVRHTIETNARAFGNGAGLLDTQVNSKTGVVTVAMKRPPVNSLSLELVTELTNTMMQFEKDKCRGMILTSVRFIFYFLTEWSIVILTLCRILPLIHVWICSSYIFLVYICPLWLELQCAWTSLFVVFQNR